MIDVIEAVVSGLLVCFALMFGYWNGMRDERKSRAIENHEAHRALVRRELADMKNLLMAQANVQHIVTNHQIIHVRSQLTAEIQRLSNKIDERAISE